jgi:hypothetical protein
MAEVQQHYRTRPSTAEFPNAKRRNESQPQFCARSLKKVRVVSRWQILTFDIL